MGALHPDSNEAMDLGDATGGDPQLQDLDVDQSELPPVDEFDREVLEADIFDASLSLLLDRVEESREREEASSGPQSNPMDHAQDKVAEASGANVAAETDHPVAPIPRH